MTREITKTLTSPVSLRRSRWRRVAAALTMASLVAACADPTALPEEEAESGPSRVTNGKADGRDLPAFAALKDGTSLDGPFAALFAPDDPVVTVELALIAEVRAAREADAFTYLEGENPYRVRYAVYNLRNPVIVAALADAADVGVDVQILIEDKQLDPSRTWNTADEELIARGFEFAPSHRGLTDRELETADLIGITGSALMHLKTRIYETPSSLAVLSGSMNPGDNATMNEETLHLIRDPALCARYLRAYDAVRSGERLPNDFDETAAVNVLFSPTASGPRPGARLLQWIEEEDEAILMMVFSLRDITAPGASGSLIELLEEKARSGVPVYVITDRKQSDGVDGDGAPIYRNDGTEDRLRRAGVHVYEAINRASPFTAMHHKVGIFGLSNTRVVSDAANWSYAALGSRTRVSRNVESMLFIDSDALDEGLTGRRYLAQWLRVLERYAHQTEGEPSYQEVRDALFAHPSWPRANAQFVATTYDGVTRIGEEVYVRGSLPELGAWDHGVALSTTAETYPLWTSSSVPLPLGADFEWKLTIDGAGLRWESGDNRVDVARPAALMPNTIFHARWR